MKLSPNDKNTREAWEDYFSGGWERNDGRNQTRLFAEYFLDAVPLPPDAESLLDVGCALGDALPAIRRRYPRLRLTGCDVCETAVAKARERYGDLAAFHRWGFDDIQGTYDLIYCSNTLEHFENYLDVARTLLRHARFLYVLVPYKELRGGRPLRAEPGEWHVATFTRSSFAPLVAGGSAARVRSWVRYTPGAWGTGPVPLRARLGALWTGQPQPVTYRQIFYEIRAAKAP